MQQAVSQTRVLVKTSETGKKLPPGIFRRGSRYVVTFRDPQGRQRKRSARTLAEARDIKATMTADVARGEFRDVSRITFGEYAPEWIATYKGRTRRGFRDETRRDYRRALGLDEQGQPLDPPSGAVAFFGRMPLSAIAPLDVKRYAEEVRKRGVAENTVRLAVAPIKCLLATAVEDGLIRSNPAAGLRLGQAVAGDGSAEREQAKALTEDELRRLIENVETERRLLIEFLAQTGLRISECVALRWQDIDFGRRRLRVERRFFRGRYGPPKSRFGRREVPLSPKMARRLWALRKERPGASDETTVFADKKGVPIDASTAFRAVKAAAKKAGVPWAGLHTLRHTCATILFARGLNAKQVQRWLGHHAASFTLDTYIGLLNEELPEPDFFDDSSDATRAGLSRMDKNLRPNVETVARPSDRRPRRCSESPGSTDQRLRTLASKQETRVGGVGLQS
jgi:integrase